MGKVNLVRVILGGLVAGLVTNVGEFLLHEKVIKVEETAAMAAMGKNASTGSIPVWIVLAFAFGIALIWVYAAIRPRYGPGAGTAARAALAVWFVGTFMSAVGMVNTGMCSQHLATITAVWGLVETILAAIVGGWLYREA